MDTLPFTKAGYDMKPKIGSTVGCVAFFQLKPSAAYTFLRHGYLFVSWIDKAVNICLIFRISRVLIVENDAR